ncbi:hypothetical protein DPMN_003483 [Dreissena polymorpha]|uniref:Uncharacterized protein n=1 Tax=Dreissena polymorpha TaxID=45954 RepID=A0A9D4MNB7_DREPO|nr:hypothetical protein DPMN_003483 [Dreissena polymorpha]
MMNAKHQVDIFNIAKVMAYVFGPRLTDRQFNCYMPPYRVGRGVCRQSKMTKSDIADYQGLWFIKEIIATVHHVSMYKSTDRGMPRRTDAKLRGEMRLAAAYCRSFND